jgi:hypothetical protein
VTCIMLATAGGVRSDANKNDQTGLWLVLRDIKSAEMVRYATYRLPGNRMFC